MVESICFSLSFALEADSAKICFFPVSGKIKRDRETQHGRSSA